MTRKSVELQPKGLQNLRAYQLAKKLAHRVYDLTAEFPKDEFRLIGQMRGAAVSVFGNIAEGYGRKTTYNSQSSSHPSTYPPEIYSEANDV